MAGGIAVGVGDKLGGAFDVGTGVGEFDLVNDGAGVSASLAVSVRLGFDGASID